MSPVDITNRKRLLLRLFLTTILLFLVWVLVPVYIISVIKIAGLTGIFSASRGVLTLFVIYLIFQFPIQLYNISVLRKQHKELTATQRDKIKIFSMSIATVGSLLLNYDQLTPILYFATYLLASNRIVAYLDVKLNLSKMQGKLALFAMDFLFILLGSINPAIRSGVVPFLIFIVMLKVITDGMGLVSEYAGKRSEQIQHD